VYRGTQSFLYGEAQPLNPDSTKRRDGPQGRNTGTKQCFRSIDVAQTSHLRLVHEKEFGGQFRSCRDLSKPVFGELGV
jgi:hypothetical protein